MKSKKKGAKPLAGKLEDLAALERQCKELVAKIKHDLTNSIEKIKLPGVMVNPKAPFMATVSAKHLDPRSWAPVTYIPKEQARKVMEYLGTTSTLDSICKKVELLLVNGYVDDKDRTRLHEDTLAMIRDSELGKFVLSRMNERNEQGASAGKEPIAEQ